MTVRYGKAWLFVAACIFLLAALGVMAFVFIAEDKNYALAVVCLLLAAVALTGTFFRFNYGIRINSKRVTAIDGGSIKILRYDDVSSIVVKFTDRDVLVRIKMKNQQEHIFVWDAIASGNTAFQIKNKIKIDSRFVEKSIESLSKCEKVKIQNFYTV